VQGFDVHVGRVVEWLEEHGFHRGECIDQITHAKPAAQVYIDDRALHFMA
jgi:hypothetical protein